MSLVGGLESGARRAGRPSTHPGVDASMSSTTHPPDHSGEPRSQACAHESNDQWCSVTSMRSNAPAARQLDDGDVRQLIDTDGSLRFITAGLLKMDRLPQWWGGEVQVQVRELSSQVTHLAQEHAHEGRDPRDTSSTFTWTPSQASDQIYRRLHRRGKIAELNKVSSDRSELTSSVKLILLPHDRFRKVGALRSRASAE